MDQPHISGKAVIITGGLLTDEYAKSAHGLIRFSKRFKLLGVIDHVHEGKDAGEVAIGRKREIPIVGSISAFIARYEKPEYAIIGMATKGGRMSKELYPHVVEALKNGIHIVNGLHQPFNEIEELKELAYEHGAVIYDIRQGRAFDDMHFWKGEKIGSVKSLKIPVLGLDCAVGKRTTSRLLVETFEKMSVPAEMIHTGQTGWMQGADYGFIFDATPNDFIPGEIEHWLYTCWQEQQPNVILIEGQSGLRNPSGPCGLELILPAEADGIILQAKPSKTKYKGLENYPTDIPDILDEVDLLERFGVPVVALTISGEGWPVNRTFHFRDELQKRTELPIGLPLIEPMDHIANAILDLRK